MCQRNINQSPLACPNGGHDPQRRHAPWLGIELATFWLTGRHSVHWTTPTRAYLVYLCARSLSLLGPMADCMGSKGLSFNMAQNLWPLALFLALIIRGRIDRRRTLGTQKGHSLDFASGTTISHVDGLEYFPCDNARTPLPMATSGPLTI